MSLEMTDQKAMILDALKRGETLTGLKALRIAGTMKLATRIGELERAGHVINKGWTKTPKGKRVRTYYI
jgi:hypothetical protein